MVRSSLNSTSHGDIGNVLMHSQTDNEDSTPTNNNDVKTFITSVNKKLRPGRKGMSFEYAFTKEETEKLITLWSEREILYNTSLPEYSDAEKKDKAYHEIAEIMGIEVSHIHSKMNSLRSYYGQLRRSLLEAQHNGNGTKEQKQPSWPFFPLMSFLTYNCMSNGFATKTKRPVDRVPWPGKSPRKAIVHATPSHQENEFAQKEQCDLMQNGTVMLHSPIYQRSERDEDDLFGELIANLIRKIPSCDEKDELKIRLQATILEAKRSILPS